MTFRSLLFSLNPIFIPVSLRILRNMVVQIFGEVFGYALRTLTGFTLGAVLAAVLSEIPVGAQEGVGARNGISAESFRIVLPAWLEETASGRERLYSGREPAAPFIGNGPIDPGLSEPMNRQITQARSYFAEAERRREMGTAVDLAGAVKLYEQSIAGWAEIRVGGYEAERAQASTQLGQVLNDLGRRIDSIEAYDRARLAWRAVGDRAREATILAQIGRLQQTLGLEVQARHSYEQARLILQLSGLTKFSDGQPGRLSSQAVTLFNLGKLSEEIGQPQEALPLYQRAIELWRESGDKVGQATVLNALGSLAVKARQAIRAREYFEQALPLWREAGDNRGLAITHSNLGFVQESGGALQSAVTAYEAALPFWQALGDRRGEANSRHDIGRLETTLGNVEGAISQLNEAARLRREAGDERGLTLSLSLLGFLHQTRGNLLPARVALEEAVGLIRRTPDGSRLAGILNSLGEIYVSQREMRMARKALEESMAVPPAAGTTASRVPTLSILARVYSALGDRPRASECYLQLIPRWTITIPPRT